MRPALRIVPRIAAVAVVGLLVGAGVSGGLVRAGVPVQAWPEAVGGHAFLMVCAFLGTVIALERAVALRHPAALPGPLASALAGVALIAGWPATARAMALAASLSFCVVNAVLLRRQAAAHTVLLGVGALAWAGGCALDVAGLGTAAVVPLWLAFLVITIAAERLEMTRSMRHRPGVQTALGAVLGALLAAGFGSAVTPVWGGVVYGASLTALAVWLGRFDIARRTVHAAGLSRYMAVCLLSGYAWLGLAGVAWVAMTLGWPARDAAVHALSLGFVMSMVFGHAPVILPALARVKLAFGPVFYLPLLMLQASLALRLAGGFIDPRWTAFGAAGNALALASFVLTAAGAALAWRLGWAALPRNSRHDPVVRH